MERKWFRKHLIFSKDVFKQGSSVGCRDFRRHTPSRIGAIGAYVYEPIIQDVRNLEIEARMNTVLFSHPTGSQICNPRVSTKIERQGALSTDIQHVLLASGFCNVVARIAKLLLKIEVLHRG